MMKRGYKRVFWGLILVIFNINIGPVNILPDFMGYFLISIGLSTIRSEYENDSFKLSAVIANILGVYTLVASLLAFANVGHDLSGNKFLGTGLTMLVSIANLVMEYNILSGTISLFNNIGKTFEAEEMHKIQRNYTYLTVIALFLMSVSFNISNEIIVMAILIYYLIIRIYYISVIRKIKKFFENEEILPETEMQDDNFKDDNNEEEKL